jgi:hypothetical protein
MERRGGSAEIGVIEKGREGRQEDRWRKGRNKGGLGREEGG